MSQNTLETLVGSGLLFLLRSHLDQCKDIGTGGWYWELVSNPGPVSEDIWANYSLYAWLITRVGGLLCRYLEPWKLPTEQFCNIEWMKLKPNAMSEQSQATIVILAVIRLFNIRDQWWSFDSVSYRPFFYIIFYFYISIFEKKIDISGYFK